VCNEGNDLVRLVSQALLADAKGKTTDVAVKDKPRLIVVSPFLDKQHGTERRVVEWISQLADTFEFHIYSQRVEDIDLSKVTWHRIPKLPGPHLCNYLWWFAANRMWRGWDRRVRGLKHDIVFSPGVNCLDAEVVSVHIVFAEYARRNRAETEFANHPLWTWPQRLHRKLYYALIAFLESRLYRRRSLTLILIARRTAAGLARFYGRNEDFPVVYLGLDHDVFNPGRRTDLRAMAREELGIPEYHFALLLVGNDWQNKGVAVVLDAMERVRDLPIDLVLVGREDAAAYRATVHEHQLDGRVFFCSPRRDVEFYYAAADAYVGPSLEDTFAQPPAEAMACGLPVIVSSSNGTSEIMSDGVDGLILPDPVDAGTLAGMIRRIYEDGPFRDRLGANAVETARRYTWERNGRELATIFQAVLRRKSELATQSLAQKS
jgi:glycosyltransferase involved in cell wall biosynthesis